MAKYQSESTISILYNLALQFIKNNKKIQQKRNEIKLKHIRRTIYDLENLKQLPRNIIKPKMQVSFNERISNLRRMENALIKENLRKI